MKRAAGEARLIMDGKPVQIIPVVYEYSGNSLSITCEGGQPMTLTVPYGGKAYACLFDENQILLATFAEKQMTKGDSVFFPNWIRFA